MFKESIRQVCGDTCRFLRLAALTHCEYGNLIKSSYNSYSFANNRIHIFLPCTFALICMLFVPYLHLRHINIVSYGNAKETAGGSRVPIQRTVR